MAFAWTVVLAALGVDVGWQPLPSGGMEYIIQIEPDALDSLLDGRDVVSDVPTSLRDARSYRVRVGREPLPQQGAGSGVNEPTPAKRNTGRAGRPAPLELSAESGWQPLVDGGMEYIIQIAPDALTSLADGDEVVSEVPPSMRDVRSCRIHLGQDPLPRKGFKVAPQGEPTLAKPKIGASHPALASNDTRSPDVNLDDGPTPTVRGQGPEKQTETAAQARARRFREQNGKSPKRLDDPPAAEDTDRDFGTDYSADPFTADRSPRVAQAQFRDDQPSSSSSSKTKLGSGKGSSLGSGSQKPTRAAIDDEEELEDDHSKSAGSKSRTISTSTKTSNAGSEKSTGVSSRTARVKESDGANSDSKPWFPLTMALIALFASLGGNWYLGWMSWGLRNKYQQALNDRKWRREDEYEPSSRVA